MGYIGLWGVGSNGNEDTCQPMSALFLLDTVFHFSRAASIIASLTGGLCIPIIIFACDKPKYEWLFRLLVWPFATACLFQFLTLSILDTFYCAEAECTLDQGGVFSITAAFYWLYCTCVVTCIPLSEPDRVSKRVINAEGSIQNEEA